MKLTKENYSWGTLRKIGFGRNGIDGQCIIHPNDWKLIVENISSIFRDEQGLMWKIVKDYENDKIIITCKNASHKGTIQISKFFEELKTIK